MTEEGNLELRILNLEKLMHYETQQTLSPAKCIRGLAWKISVNPCSIFRHHAKANATQYKALQFFLQCNGGDDSSTWSCHASATLHIVSQKEGVDVIVHQLIKIHQLIPLNDHNFLSC
ncbi:MATH domain-containing protein [Ditylenchus destructor]|uniref:MATH domain-containing protein n=1 Tax=Ditylenchus destructor TaxID=166010 RepID=A0AAD4MM34_9BILA|nr:MATH domain-containing protein [Ditylenchus destructor]